MSGPGAGRPPGSQPQAALQRVQRAVDEPDQVVLLAVLGPVQHGFARAPVTAAVTTRTSRSSDARPARSAIGAASACEVSASVSVIRARRAGTSVMSRARRRSSSGSSSAVEATASVRTARREAIGVSSAGLARRAATITGSYASVRTMSSLAGK